MKNSWKHTAQRVMSLILSFILTLTLITPTLAAGEVYDNDTDTTPPTGELQTSPTPEDEAADEDDPTAIAPFSLMTVGNLATVVVWDGTSTQAATVNEKGEYEISTAAQLAWLAAQVNGGNSFSGKTIKLTADIRLNSEDVPDSGNPWTPIGNDSKQFKGTFDGQGHTVSGLYINATASYQGLFGNAAYNAAIKNLIVTGSVSAKGKKSNVAGIVGCNNSGTAQNCGFYGTVTVKKINGDHRSNNNGGVVGKGNASNCWYWCTDTANATPLGVTSGTATNSYHNISGNSKDTFVGEEKTLNDRISDLNTGNDACGMKWVANTEKGYPTLKTVRTVTVEAHLSDRAGVVQILDENNAVVEDPSYAISDDVTAVKLQLAGGYTGDDIYVKSNLTQPCDDNAKLTSSNRNLTYYIGNDTTVTLYYGTEADFEMDSSWHDSAVAANTKQGEIKTAKQLRYLAHLVNERKQDFTGWTITLTQDIPLSGDWTPIGSNGETFNGTFNGNFKTISGLNGNLFGTVQGGTIQKVNITGTGKLVDTLTSGKVQYCSSTASVSTGGGLVGTNNGTVTNSYYYNAERKNTAVASGGTVTNCFYLATTSTFGTADDTGARTAAEFAAGRVTWELNGKSTGIWKQGTDKPTSNGGKVIYELTLTKLSGEGSVTITNTAALTNGDTQYLYGEEGTEVQVTEPTLADGNKLTYFPIEPKKIRASTSLNATPNTYYYTIGKEVEPDISWYNDTDTEFTLTEVDQLFGFAKLVNSGNTFSGKTVNLGGDIDLAGYNWTPIGNTYVFAGTFDGGNHRIHNLNVNVAGGQHAGLFGQVQHGTVRHLQVEGSANAGGTSCAGGIVGYLMSGTVQNCLSNVTVTGTSYVGGIAGRSEGTIDNCWNEGNVTSANSGAGGIAGSGSATNCKNVGTVTSNGGQACGIAPTATNCYNTGDVTGATAHGIGSSVTNSYYICRVNNVSQRRYAETAMPDADNISNDYKVGDTPLVDKLNESAEEGGWLLWFTNPNEPHEPIFVEKWNGYAEEGAPDVIKVIYNANGGEGGTKSFSYATKRDPITNDLKPVTVTIKSVSEVGFKHENGAFDKWTTGETGGAEYAVGRDVSLTEDLTLYAQWNNIWEGNGTENEPYQIPNDEKLTALQKKVNDEGFGYADKWFKLTNSIALTGNWTPIGTDSHPFSGSLNGGDKTISGLKVETDGQFAGLFGNVRGAYGAPVTMRDLTLKNGSVTITRSGTSWCGGLVANAGGGIALELRNVVAENLTVSGGNSSGGLLGSGSAAMTNCHNKGGSVSGTYAGGLVGRGNTNLQNHVFTGCTNSAAVSGKEFAGGMAGNEASRYGSYTDCANSGSISAAQGSASGIAAGGSYERCSNSGTVTGKQAAGIASGGDRATYCSNIGPIEGTDYAAGILTSGNYGGAAEFCWNTGSVEASTPFKAFGILYGLGTRNEVNNSFSYVSNLPLAPATAKDKVAASYYLADKKDSVSSAGEWASEADFRCGKVAWGVDGGLDNHKNYWTQGDEGYPIPIAEGTSTSYYRAKVSYGTGGTAVLTSGRFSSADQDDAVYGPAGTSVTVTATPYDDTYALKSLKLDLMSSGQFVEIESGSSFNLSQANAEVVAAFTGGGTGGGGGTGSGGEGQGDGNGEGDGSGSEEDTGLQSGSNPDVEYDVKNLVLSAYGAWGAEGSGKAFVQWLQSNAQTLRNLVTNSLDNMAGAARGKSSGDAAATAAALLANLNTYCGVDSKSATSIGRALQQYLDSASTDSFTGWLTSGSGMASGTVEAILTQYTESLLALTDRLYTKWESSGTSMTFPQWLDAQQVSVENLSESAQEPEQDTTNDPQTTDAPEDVPDGQESEGGSAGGGNSIWAVIGDAVRQNPIIVWSIVAAIVAIVAVGAVRRYHKVKKDERDDK